MTEYEEWKKDWDVCFLTRKKIFIGVHDDIIANTDLNTRRKNLSFGFNQYGIFEPMRIELYTEIK